MSDVAAHTAPECMAALKRIAHLIRHDPGQRGLSSLAPADDLPPAAASLLRGERILIVTGFCIRAAMIGENDGPPGALALADALHRLGKKVTLITDRHSAGLLAAAEPLFKTQDDDSPASSQPFPIISLPDAQRLADRQIDEIVRTHRPTHVLAIERPGSALDGHRYSMRGERLDDIVPAADRLMPPAEQRNYTTIAIGDGGNELGLGALRSRLKNRVAHGELIFCATPADYVIPAGVSNWGGHALVAALSVLSGRSLLRPVMHEQRVLETLLAAGAVDGSLRRRALSVDGIGWHEYAQILTALHHAVDAALQTT